jgi:hypothetical protein
MYESPSIHFEIARQRHEDVLRAAEKERLLAEARAAAEPTEQLRHVRGVFAGILAAVSGLSPRTRTAQQPGLNPA